MNRIELSASLSRAERSNVFTFFKFSKLQWFAIFSMVVSSRSVSTNSLSSLTCWTFTCSQSVESHQEEYYYWIGSGTTPRLCFPFSKNSTLYLSGWSFWNSSALKTFDYILKEKLTVWYGRSMDRNRYHHLKIARRNDWNWWTKDVYDCTQRNSSICERKWQRQKDCELRKWFLNHYLLQVKNDRANELQSYEFYNETELVENSNLFFFVSFQLIYHELHYPNVSYA